MEKHEFHFQMIQNLETALKLFTIEQLVLPLGGLEDTSADVGDGKELL